MPSLTPSFLALCGAVVLVLVLSACDEQRWHQFSQEHNCRSAGQEGHNGLHPSATVDYAGRYLKINTVWTGRWLYVCDGNKIIWRES